MQVKVNINGSLTAEELTAHIETMEFPAILVSNDLKILAKNRASLRYTSGMAVGRKIKRFLPEGEDEKIAEMITGEVVTSEIIRADEHIGVTVVCGPECRMIVFQPLGAEICLSINEIYGKMSGYDHSITQNTLPGTAQSARTREITRLVSGLLDFHKEVHRLPCFNINAAARGLAEEIHRISRRTAKAFKFSTPQKETIVSGSEHDFLLILTFLSTLCADVGKTALIELFETGNEAVCRVSAVGTAQNIQAFRLTPSKEFFNDLDGETGDIKFWSHLIKLLADSNLWDFSAEHDENGNPCFTLHAPIGEPLDDIVFRDPSNAFIRQLLELFPIG